MSLVDLLWDLKISPIRDPLKLHLQLCSYKWSNLVLSSQEFRRGSRASAITSMALDSCFYSYLMVASQDASLIIYDLDDSNQVIAEFEKGKAHSAEITSVKWFPQDSGSFVTASRDHTIKVWDANTLKRAFTWNMNEPVNCMEMARKEAMHLLIAAGVEGRMIRLCDMKSGASTHTLKGHSN